MQVAQEIIMPGVRTVPPGRIKDDMAEAQRLGLNSRDMLANIDERADRIGKRFAEAIKNGNVAWDGDIAKLVAEAEELREYKRAFLAVVLQ